MVFSEVVTNQMISAQMAYKVLYDQYGLIGFSSDYIHLENQMFDKLKGRNTITTEPFDDGTQDSFVVNGVKFITLRDAPEVAK